ncbi:MAG TPA: hypothetical protein PKV27_04890, partial [Ilumatobacteraceae bacterium]|nr:hypothetical protein [Ilumatobacteraceae bacterium]
MIDLQGPPIEWMAISPLLILLGAALAMLVGAVLTPAWPRRFYALFTAAAAAAAIVMTVIEWHRHRAPRLIIAQSMRIDNFTLWLVIIVVGAALLSTLVTDDYLEREQLTAHAPEVYALYLLSSIGA